MPVVINDFEVVPEPAAAGNGGNAAQDGKSQSAKREKQDLKDKLQHIHERAERVRAH